MESFGNLGSWQRKSDIKFSLIQKSTKKAMNATLTILDECQKASSDVQKIAQTIRQFSIVRQCLAWDLLKKKGFHKDSSKSRI